MFWNSAWFAAIFGHGSRETVQEFTQARLDWLAAHSVATVPRPNGVPGSRQTPRGLLQMALWDYERGDTAAAAATVRWLDAHDGASLGDVVRMLLATDEKRTDAPAIRARLDSSAREGCCAGVESFYINFVLARAFANAGDNASALRALRRSRDEYFLAPTLKQEGEIAYRLKDYAGARRAFEKYLVLRSDPEPALRAERDSVRALVNRLKSSR
jgi:hypothetical protein